MAYNYSIVLDHKPKIIIPYTDIVVNGKMFLFIAIVISAIINLPLIIITMNKGGKFIPLTVSIFLGVAYLILNLVQNFNHETGNFNFIDILYVRYHKYINSKKTIQVSTNNSTYLRKKVKIPSSDEIIAYNFIV